MAEGSEKKTKRMEEEQSVYYRGLHVISSRSSRSSRWINWIHWDYWVQLVHMLSTGASRSASLSKPTESTGFVRSNRSVRTPTVTSKKFRLTFIFLRHLDRLRKSATLSSPKVLRSSLKPSRGNFLRAYW